MASPPTIAIIAAGVMGAGVAKRLASGGCRILTILAGRSEGSRRRAEEAGMEDATLDAIVQEADWVLSILPPDSAEQFARVFLKTIEGSPKPPGRRYPIFVDCNAKNPETARHLAGLFLHGPTIFMDASIVGLPPSDGHNPTFYASADPSDQHVLEGFAALAEYGLKVELLQGEETAVGDASALKMSFSGIMKGMVGLYDIMILSAYAHSPATATALLHELRTSLPLDLQRFAFYAPHTITKAYRFVREMEESAGFVRQNVDNAPATFASDSAAAHEDTSKIGDVAQVYEGFAHIFQRIAESAAGEGRRFSDDLTDVEVLRKLADDAKWLTSNPPRQ